MIGSSLSGISFAGLSSGIDSDLIISRLIAIESIPIQRLMRQQQQIQGRQSLLKQLQTNLSGLAGAASALNSEATFRPLTATSSKPEVATISAGPGATAGTYNLEVLALAQAHKVSSAAQSSASEALGLSGTLIVNGSSVTVEASDSLTAIAQRINGLGAGVIASVIDGGANNAYLTLTSSKSGAANAVQLADLTGTLATSLGFTTGADSIRESVTNGATSVAFSSATTPVGELLGVTGLGPTSFLINGVQVNVDLSTQSLTDIASAITAAGTGTTASVRTVEIDGRTSYKLDIVGVSTPTFSDTDGTLKALGILQKGFGNQLVAAQDASFRLDGIALTSATNSVTTAIPDVTLTLLKANATTPETSTISLSQDNAAVKAKVKEFVTNFNAVVDFVKANSAFDTKTFDTGPLFGDPLARQVLDSISGMVFTDVAGLSGAYSNLAELGFGFDTDGKLKLEESALDQALSQSPQAVGAVFRATGETTSANLKYVSSTSKSVASGTGFYEVSITQLATLGSYLAEAAQTSATTTSETLTFSGALIGSEPYNLIVPLGATQADIVQLINNDSKLKNLMTASVDGGFLKLTSKKYGTNGNFSVVSNLAAGPDNSGIGTSEAGTKVTGVDVAGTINGEAATGSGQYLTGNAGNATTDGLQVLYTGTSTGIVGSVRLMKGVGSLMSDLISGYTDSISGLFSTNDQSLQAQIDSISDSIEDLQERIALREQSLRRRFAAMEQAIAQLQTQQARLGAMSSPR